MAAVTHSLSAATHLAYGSRNTQSLGQIRLCKKQHKGLVLKKVVYALGLGNAPRLLQQCPGQILAEILEVGNIARHTDSSWEWKALRAVKNGST